MSKRITRTIALIVIFGMAASTAIAARAITRASIKELEASLEDPAADSESALARFARLQAQEAADTTLNPVCHAKLLTHGHKVERAIILMHGMTNCPEQYAALAPLFYERGYNVLIPRMPHNGLADPDTAALQDLTAEQLRDSCNTTVDIARGLGEHITYAGISVGGVIAAWVAQNRPDVEQVVLIAPAFTISRGLDVGISRFAMYLLLLLPNIMTQRFRPFTGALGHNYHGFATRGLGQAMRLGFSVYDAARTTKPAAQSVVVIINAADMAVENNITRKLVRRWQATG